MRKSVHGAGRQVQLRRAEGGARPEVARVHDEALPRRADDRGEGRGGSRHGGPVAVARHRRERGVHQRERRAVVREAQVPARALVAARRAGRQAQQHVAGLALHAEHDGVELPVAGGIRRPEPHHVAVVQRRPALEHARHAHGRHRRLGALARWHPEQRAVVVAGGAAEVDGGRRLPRPLRPVAELRVEDVHVRRVVRQLALLEPEEQRVQVQPGADGEAVREAAAPRDAEDGARGLVQLAVARAAILGPASEDLGGHDVARGHQLDGHHLGRHLEPVDGRRQHEARGAAERRAQLVRDERRRVHVQRRLAELCREEAEELALDHDRLRGRAVVAARGRERGAQLVDVREPLLQAVVVQIPRQL